MNTIDKEAPTITIMKETMIMDSLFGSSKHRDEFIEDNKIGDLRDNEIWDFIKEMNPSEYSDNIENLKHTQEISEQAEAIQSEHTKDWITEGDRDLISNVIINPKSMAIGEEAMGK